jgi:hypothetical protein
MNHQEGDLSDATTTSRVHHESNGASCFGDVGSHEFFIICHK